MSTQRALRWSQRDIPERHLCSRAATGQEPPIRAPVEVVEGGGVAPNDAKTLATVHIPHPDGTICATTEQGAAVRRKDKCVDDGSMPIQCSPSAALSDVPEPDRIVKASTGQRASIWAPDHA